MEITYVYQKKITCQVQFEVQARFTYGKFCSASLG